MSTSNPADVRERLAAAAVGPPRDPVFSFGLAFAEDYSKLLSGATETADGGFGELLEAGAAAGRMILCAEAGAGKTSVTRQILADASKAGLAVARVDLMRWTPEVQDAWEAAGVPSRRMSLMLRRAADVPTSERELAAATETGPAFVVVDGLNEVPKATTPQVLEVIDDFAARCPWAVVLVCDRLTRRRLPSARWRLLTISQVCRPGTADGPDNALLLDLHPGPGVSEAGTLLDRLVSVAGDQAVDGLAAAALDLYADGQGRYFERHRLDQTVREGTVEALIEAGDLLTEGDRAYFRHHLFHDALAARAVACDPGRWRRDVFDHLTFKANSVDAVGLALEFIDQADMADRFVLAVYDWNLYAAAAAVAHVRRHGTGAVTDDLEVALLAVLAERRWDPIAPSVEQVEDALRVSPHPLASALLQASDLDQAVAIVGSYVESHAVADGVGGWARVYLEQVRSDELLGALHGGPIPGWVAANVLRRRGQLDPGVRSALVRLVDEANDPTVRWRAVHALGADAGEGGVDVLLKVIAGDDDRLVRYGAVRALVETAAASDELRDTIIEDLRAQLDGLRRDPTVFDELQRALELRDPPDGWAGSVAPLIEQLFLESRSIDDQDHWLRVGRRITRSVEQARAAA